MEFKTHKKLKRWESKKRKVEAFLELTKNSIHLKDQTTPQTIENGTPKKVPKVETTSKEDDPYKKEAHDKSEDVKAELDKLRLEKHARQKAMMQKPKVYLTLDNLQVPSRQPQSFAMCPVDSVEPKYLPLFVLDLQHLLLYAIQGNVASYKPRWCKLLRINKISRVIVLLLNDVSATEYVQYPDSFPYISSTFHMKAEMICPSEYGSSVLQELLTVPLSINQVRRDIKDRTWEQYKAEREKLRSLTELNVEEKPEIFTGDKKDNKAADPENDCSRLDLLLSPLQMIQENYPLPLDTDLTRDYIYSNEGYKTVSINSPMFAVDCEMCMTDANSSELTRVSVINEELEVVFDSLVKPYKKITNYLTRYSGITKGLLKNITTRIENVQQTLQTVLPPDAILCGQSLNSDLHALKMYHPYVIDTSVIYNLSGIRGMKPGLKKLAAHFLKKDIQAGQKGHSSVEDAVTTMELVKLKLENGRTFGDIISGGFVFPNQEAPPTYSEKMDLSLSVNSISSDSKPVENDNIDDINEDTNVLQACKGCMNCKSPSESSDDATDTECDNVEVKLNSKDTTGGCDNCSIVNNSTKQFLKLEKGHCSGKPIGKSKEDDSEVSPNKKTVFFERPGTNLSRNFFELTKECKKSVTLLGDCMEFKEKIPSDDEESLVTYLPTISDKITAKQCKKSLCSSFLTMALFKEFTSQSSVEIQEKKLRKLDRRVKKVLEHAPANSLVTIVMAGPSDITQNHKTLSFVKIL